MTMEENEKKNSGLERQRAILAGALERAQKNDGVLLNGTQKAAPRILDKGYRVAPVNALMMAMHADDGEFKTNTYTMYTAAKQRGETVKGHEKGVPFTWTNRNQYVSNDNPEDKISRAEFNKLPDGDKEKYHVNPREDIYVLFNIDQTTMSHVHKDEYNSHVAEYGARQAEPTAKEMKDLRAEVNQSLVAIGANLVPVKRDGTGVAHYDAQKNTVFMPAQKDFPSYADYVQETSRQIAQVTGIPQLLNRQGVVPANGKEPAEDLKEREMLVVELASAHRMLELGMPAKLRPETVQHADNIIKQINENPEFAAKVISDVNRTVGMIKKAESGEKIVRHEIPSEERQEQWAAQFPMDKVPEKFEHMAMIKDDEGKWTLVAKPENEPTFAIHPSKEDVGMYFDVIKNDHDEAHVENFRNQFAQKHYAELAKDPGQAVNIFHSNAPQETLDRISNVNAFKARDSKILLVAAIDGEKQPAREISQNQWQRMFLADDKRDYKVHMAATLYADVLAAKEQIKHDTSPQVEGSKLHEENEHREYHEQLDKKEEEKKQKEKEQQKPKEKTPELAPLLKQFYDLKQKHPDALLLFRTGDFYETYSKDAEKASKILGITLTKSSKLKDKEDKPLALAGFPYHALDAYLPKLIRAGERVAICDQIEAPKRQQQEEKKPAKEAPKQEEMRQQEQHHGMHR